MTMVRATFIRDAGDMTDQHATEARRGRRVARADDDGETVSDIDGAIEHAVAFIRSKQLPTGAWISDEYFEPRTSSVHVITLAFVDRLPEVEGRAYAQFLATRQLPDGSFPPYPLAGRGDLCATALAFAALHLVDLPEQQEARQRALAFIEARGGFAVVLLRLFEAGDITAVYLAMAGLIDPFSLPDPDLSFMVIPGALNVMLRKINAGVIEIMIFVGAVTRHLRQQTQSPTLLNGKKHAVEAKRAIAFYESWLNPNGNNNGTTVQTDQAVATLVALGRTPESTSVYSAISWFDKHKIWDADGLHLRAFFNHNWMTSLCLRALLLSGVRRDDPMICDGLDFLCWSQSKLPMPKLNLSREDAHRTGGWGFEDDNLILPDTDDTGSVLGALGISARCEQSVELGADRLSRVTGAIDMGLPNLLDMQSDNGGWAGFVWNLGDKPAGPIFDKPIAVPESTTQKLRMFLSPPVELGEPAVSGLTGRVLQGLGALGYSPRSTVVRRAAAFLKEQQTECGAWWGRWFVAYLPATACALSGLAECGWDMEEAWIAKAVRWVLSKQNDDGGWGDTPKAYDDAAFAGVGPSMPPLTGHVLIGLMDAGLTSHPAVERGIAYLLSTQADDGRWPTNGWLQVYEPNSTYYLYDGAAWYAPLEALGKYRDGGPNRAPASKASRRLFVAEPIEHSASTSARQQGDPVADAVMARVFERSEQSLYRQAVGRITTLDAPLPASLPAAARDYFESTQGLPSWADRDLIARGQRLFQKHSWLMSLGLLCGSLPQSYAAANGARVLAQTQGMTRDVQRRILNTAQFLFDVCDEGGLGAHGRGIRSAQKVRLTHASVRAMLRDQNGWDRDSWGVPINQEDLAGTMLVFSVVLLDALERVGILVDPADGEAYLHLWLVVADQLGLEARYRPANLAAARDAMVRTRTDEWAESAHGRLLAQQLVSCMRHYFPGKSRGLPHALVRFFSGHRCADMLGLGRAPAAAVMLETSVATELLPRVVEPLLQQLGGRLTRVAIDAQRRGKPARFRIPLGLFSTS
jgi:Squalene-hopene cyclase C-terminal domain/ER-bound oxygenase mpaB/B'/Rubber oxygenase, catalytic domain/Prenyltransferase and squalene oxidase repeat